MLISLRKLATVVGALALLATPSHALPVIDGSMSLAGVGVTQNGANLAVSTLVHAADTLVSGPGLGDYSPVILLSSFGPHTLDLSSLPALAASFSISNASYGSFAAASALIIQRTTNFLDVFLLGTFTPGPGIPGAIASPTSLRISVNQSGASLSEAITLNSPPARVPEPATLTLFGSGLVALAFVVRRKQNG
jgi:hypothetical protein